MNVIVFGATGLLGSAVARANPGCIQVSSKDFDATDQLDTDRWFRENALIVTSSVAHICCGRVAGIGGQKNRMMFMDNMLMAMNIINALAKYQHQGNSVYYSSSCVYPKHLDEFSEQDMLTGSFEPSNEGYALAKAAGQRLCQYWNRELGARQFIVIVPPNLYGQNDNWDLNSCHVLPAIAQKIRISHLQAQPLVIWGQPDTRREFLRSDDVASAASSIVAIESTQEIFNVGMGSDIDIDSVVAGLCQRLNYKKDYTYTGDMVGKTKKLLKTDVINSLGWSPKYSYEDMLDYIAEETLQREKI